MSLVYVFTEGTEIISKLVNRPVARRQGCRKSGRGLACDRPARQPRPGRSESYIFIADYFLKFDHYNCTMAFSELMLLQIHLCCARMHFTYSPFIRFASSSLDHPDEFITNRHAGSNSHKVENKSITIK